MGKMNVGRVILGGIVAGIALNLIDFWVDGVLLAGRWNSELANLGRPPYSSAQIALFVGFGMLAGLVMIWIYAGIRPRFGAGVKTAIYAGVAVWILGWFIPNLAMMWATHLFSGHLTAFTTLGGFFETVIGAICGAAVYKEA